MDILMPLCFVDSTCGLHTGDRPFCDLLAMTTWSGKYSLVGKLNQVDFRRLPDMIWLQEGIQTGGGSLLSFIAQHLMVYSIFEVVTNIRLNVLRTFLSSFAGFPMNFCMKGSEDAITLPNRR